MKGKTLIILFVVGACLYNSGCQSEKKLVESTLFLGIPKADIQQELDDLVDLWYPRIVDTLTGGYWTNFEFDWTKSEAQPKMLVTQARGLWTAARLFQAYPQRADLREAARHGFEFLTETLWDQEHGGYWLSWPLPTEEPNYRLIYANAFVLYALAEYAKIESEPQVLHWVEKTFDWLEANAHDPVSGGYFNLVVFDPTETASSHSGEGLGWGDGKWKGQNTSIHLLEAITNAYEVLPQPKLRARLEEMLGLVRDTFVRENGSLQLYFTNDWQAVNYRDSSRAYIMEHIHDDHVSFGHDIETAFLLIEASSRLNDGKVDERTLVITKKMLNHSLRFGFAEHHQGIFEKGYYFEGQDTVEILDRRKSWWAQAEAWHSLALFAQLYPDEPSYEEAFRQMWQYLQEHLIDQKYGGWYSYGLDETPSSEQGRKAHPWKGAYHNGRALAQVLGYADGQNTGH